METSLNRDFSRKFNCYEVWLWTVRTSKNSRLQKWPQMTLSDRLLPKGLGIPILQTFCSETKLVGRHRPFRLCRDVRPRQSWWSLVIYYAIDESRYTEIIGFHLLVKMKGELRSSGAGWVVPVATLTGVATGAG